MILKDVLDNIDYSLIEEMLSTFFKENEGRKYEDLFNKLKNTATKELEVYITIHVDRIYQKQDGIDNHCVYYSLYNLDKQRFALDFIELEELVSANVLESELINPVEYISCILIELNNSFEKEDLSDIKEADIARKNSSKIEYYSVEKILNSIDK